MFDVRCWMYDGPLIPIVFVHRTSNIAHKATLEKMNASIVWYFSTRRNFFIIK
jgi:hypothetical protein